MQQVHCGHSGSATNDAGVGMLQALGIKFLDDAGKEVPWAEATWTKWQLLT